MSNGPRSRVPRQPEGQQAINSLFPVEVSFDRDAFMEAIRSHGVFVEHYRAIPDPRGMASKGDNHAVMSGHPRSNSDGFIYKKAGECRVLFSTNNMSANQRPEGVLNFATAYVTLPDAYEDHEAPVLVAPWDRFYIKDIETRVIHKQYFEANPTGVDKLQYPATCVEHLFGADGKEYVEGTHFEITKDGDIKWLTQDRPGRDPQTQRGVVCSIRFRYVPFFVAARLIHEVRVATVTDPATYDRKLERMPYQVQITRENVYHDANRTDGQHLIDDNRFVDAPSAGGVMGPNPGGTLGPGSKT